MTAHDPHARPSQVTLKTVFTVSFGMLAVVALVAAVTRAEVAIALVGSSMMIAIALDHAVAMLVRRRIKRPLAIAAVLFSLLAVLVGFGFTLIPPAVTQGKQLVQDAPHFLREARHTSLFRALDPKFHLGERLTDVEQRLPEMLEGAVAPILTALGGVLTGVGAAVTIAFLVVFMLIFGARLVRAAVEEALPRRRPTYEAVLAKIYDSVGGYLGGLALICLINATLTTTFLAIDGVAFFLPLGIASGLSSMIPYAGPLAMGTAITLITLLTKGTWYGIAAGIYVVLYGQLEGNVIGPLVFRRTVHVNPLVTMLSLVFFGEMAGLIGAIVAVPTVAAGHIVLRELLRIRRRRLGMEPGPPA